jgi:hypothetical protein
MFPKHTPPPGVDVSVPHPGRVWNFWLGGRDFFAADRAAGEAIGREFPHLAQTARAERAFGVRAVRFLAGPARIGQFLDLGAGLPAGGSTHEIAQGIAPAARVVYADHDPAIIMHAKTLLTDPMQASSPEGVVSYLDADLRDVAAVLAGAAASLELTKPVALIMLGVLGYLEDFGAVRSIVSRPRRGQLPAGRRRGVRGPGGRRGPAAVQPERVRAALPAAQPGSAGQLLRRPRPGRARRRAVRPLAAGRAGRR